MDSNIQKYLALIKTIECGSITHAAKVMRYSQSAISRMIQGLESDWNIPLVKRGRSGIQLTSDGAVILPYIKSVCVEYEKLQMQVNSINNLDYGTIRVGIFSSIASQWMPKIIKKFKEDYPKIEYELLLGDYDEIERWICEGRVDCGFVKLPTKRDLDTIFLAKDRLLVVLPVKHEMLKYDKFPMNKLSSYPSILQKKGENDTVEEILRQYNAELNVDCTTWDDYTIMSMIENAMGISILSELILYRQPYNIETRELEVPAFREIGIAFKKGTEKSIAVKKFISYLKYR